MQTNAATPLELKLTIKNTESLYKKALAITEFSMNGDDITGLAADALLQIELNSGRPAYASDEEGYFLEQMGAVIATAKKLQKKA
jgi:hypothetical protein